MPDPTLLLAFAAASIVLIVIPGPSVLFTVGRALALGRRAGIVSVAGNSVGSLLLAVVVSLGIGALIMASEVVFTVVKLLGAAYLVYLGIRTILGRRAAAATAADAAPQAGRRVFLQALVVGVTNPKTLAFFIAVLPQFVDSGAAWPAPLQLLLLGLCFSVLAFASDAVWALIAAAARTWFATSPRRLETLTATGGAMMIGLGGVLALTRRA